MKKPAVYAIILGIVIVIVINMVGESLAPRGLFFLRDITLKELLIHTLTPFLVSLLIALIFVPIANRQPPNILRWPPEVPSNWLLGSDFSKTALGVGLASLIAFIVIESGFKIKDIEILPWFWATAIIALGTVGLFFTHLLEEPFRRNSDPKKITNKMVIFSGAIGWFVLAFTFVVIDLL